MDLGIKTLSQPSAVSTEKKFVSIETGSKISGYAKEYLERLCRLKKVEYRMWNVDQFAIELESLLRETHTILLSHDDITFLDKKDLMDPSGEETSSTYFEGVSPGLSEDGPQVSSSRFAQKKSAPLRAPGTSPFSYVGRAITSDSLKELDAKEDTNVPMALGAIPPLVTEDGVTLAQVTIDESPAPFSSSVPVTTPTSSNQAIEPESVSSVIPTITHGSSSVSTIKSEAATPPLVAAPAAVVTQKIEEPKMVIPSVAPTAKTSEIITPKPKESVAPSVKTEAISATLPPVVIEKKKIEEVAHPPMPPVRRHFVSEIPLYAVPHKPTGGASGASMREAVQPSHEEKDEWDHLLLNGHLENKEKNEGVVQQITSIVPQAPTVPSPYHPIKTSVDATEHHEALPLFPAVGKAVPPRKESAPVKPPVSSESNIPDLGPDKKVMVFAPEKYGPKKANSDVPASVTKAPPVASVIPQIPSKPATVLPKVESVKSIASKPEERLSKKIPNIPAMRVMPQVIMERTPNVPAVAIERHLVPRATFSMTKSPGLNFAFAVFFIGALGLFLGASGNSPFLKNSTSYVAGVGAALSPENSLPSGPTENFNETSNSAMLPFSDDVIVVNGSKSDTILIQPVFRDSAGGAYEYTVTTGRNNPIATTTDN